MPDEMTFPPTWGFSVAVDEMSRACVLLESDFFVLLRPPLDAGSLASFSAEGGGGLLKIDTFEGVKWESQDLR